MSFLLAQDTTTISPWSIGLLLEAALRFYLVSTMSVQQFLLVSPFVFYGITGLLIAGQFLIVRRVRKRMSTQK